MTKNRRKALARSEALLGQAIDIMETVKDEEQYAMENIPENLQNGDSFEEREEVFDNLEDALSSAKEAQRYLNKAISL